MRCALFQKPVEPVAFLVDIYVLPVPAIFCRFSTLPIRKRIILFRDIISAKTPDEAYEEALLLFQEYPFLKQCRCRTDTGEKTPSPRCLPDSLYIDIMPIYAYQLEETARGFVDTCKKRYDEGKQDIDKILARASKSVR